MPQVSFAVKSRRKGDSELLDDRRVTLGAGSAGENQRTVAEAAVDAEEVLVLPTFSGLPDEAVLEAIPWRRDHHGSEPVIVIRNGGEGCPWVPLPLDHHSAAVTVRAVVRVPAGPGKRVKHKLSSPHKLPPGSPAHDGSMASARGGLEASTSAAAAPGVSGAHSVSTAADAASASPVRRSGGWLARRTSNRNAVHPIVWTDDWERRVLVMHHIVVQRALTDDQLPSIVRAHCASLTSHRVEKEFELLRVSFRSSSRLLFL